MEVSVSILGGYDNLDETIEKVNNSICDYVHIDVMDGKFVDDVKFPLDITKDVIKKSKKKTEVHLMVDDINTVRKYIELKPDVLIFHVEIIKDKDIINEIKKNKIKVGLAINPETKIEKLLPYLKDINLVLFMSVKPGKGGQSFKKSTLSKIKKLKKIAPKNLIINIDGGINDTNSLLCKQIGCTRLVSGSYITNSKNYDDKINKLKNN